ncbi:MAG TPA: hypothetical protein VHB48_07370 [Chitinophagaceae bacterium]|jgi:YVTN family beta-propeller protein|nr:hypothetical protein [Chitinophagaceae bacterium]
MQKSLFLILAAMLTLPFAALAQVSSGYNVKKVFHIASPGGWDYITADPNSNRLYVSHGLQVNILNKTTGDSLGVIANTTGVHGIALVQPLGKGYTSNGRLNNVTEFDLKTGEVLRQIAAGENPDAIMYDSYSKKIITCNGRSHDLSVIDPVKGQVVATIPVGGKPETAVSDGAGKIFVNIEDKNEIAAVEITTGKVIAHWPIAPAEGPTGLAIDRKTHRIFAGCEKKLVILNTDNGKVVTTMAIGEGCDGVGFDAGRNLVFASCGEGVLSVIKEETGDKYTLLENVATKKGARTIAIDEATHNIYLPTADFGAPPAGGGRPPMLAGTFQVLMVSK